jgi:hypothetical protein
MKIEDLTVVLRPRNPWEAVELGMALTRRHLGAVLRPWLALTLPVFVLLNVVFAWLDAAWLAAVAMWWLKPVFDRVPMFVLSRAVFGQAPGTAATLRAQWRWGMRWMPGYLTWRRPSPWRAMNLPVDLLEGGSGAEARTRRGALVAPLYGVGALVTSVFSMFEMNGMFGLMTVALLFVPQEAAEEVTVRAWNVALQQPLWLQLVFNVLGWAVVTFLEPFYIGAGFGLYLNRRTQIECWDIEMVLRRLRARLTQVAAPALLLVATGLALLAGPVPAAQAAPKANPNREQPTLQEVFGKQAVRDEGWEQAVKRAYEDPKVRPRQVVTRWVPRNPDEPAKLKEGSDWKWLATLFALVGEYGLWAVLGLLVLALLWTSPRWVRWMRDTASREGRELTPVTVEAAAPLEPLPHDVPATAMRLWREGHQRDALALVYRASVEDMARLANVVLVPGATEAHTLRASRKLPRAEDRDVFARTVRTWQYAAYAHGLPSTQDFEALLRALVQAFGWPRAGLDRAVAEGAA